MEAFREERIKALAKLLVGKSNVIIDHDYQYGSLVSIFCPNYYNLDISDIKAEAESNDIRCGLWYEDPYGESFEGNRLKNDMEWLGYSEMITLCIDEDDEMPIRLSLMIESLEQRYDYVRMRESDIYPVRDPSGNVCTDHPRVVQVATGEFVSHPLCKVCGEHTGICYRFETYADAVFWANDKSIRCESCFDKLSTKYRARLEKEMIDADGCGQCSCPLGR